MADGAAYPAAELGTELGENRTELIAKWAGLVDDTDTLETLLRLARTLERPVEDTALGREILANAATESTERAVREGNVSKMKAATGLTNQRETGGSFYTEVAERLSDEGSIGLVFGAPGSGKTTAIIDSAEVWRAVTGGKIISNVDWELASDTFESDSEMLELMGSYQGPVLAVLDEIGQELSGFGSGSKKAEAFSDALLFIRKQQKRHGEYAKRGSVLAVAHTKKKTAASIRRVASFAVEKPDKHNKDRARLLESEGGKDQFERVAEYQGLTPTDSTYAEYEASEFEVTEEYDSDSDTDEQQGPPPEKRERIKLALRQWKERGRSKKDVAEDFDVVGSTLYNWYQRYDKGQYDWFELDE